VISVYYDDDGGGDDDGDEHAQVLLMALVGLMYVLDFFDNFLVQRRQLPILN